MEDYGCRKNGLSTCEVIGLVLGIIAGVAVGILFSLGLIPSTISFIIIALITSAVVLAILIFSLFGANAIKGCSAFYKCICKHAGFVLTGAIGTLLAGTIALTAGLTVTALISIIFVALTVFFFVIMITSIICLYSCIIKQICRGRAEID